MKILFALYMIDYALTAYGVNIGAIAEGNPFMVWVFDLPIYLSLPYRILYFGLVAYIPIKLALKHPDKCRPVFVKAFYWLLVTANVGIMALHTYWIAAHFAL